MPTQINRRRSSSTWIWVGFFLVIGMGVLLVLFAGIRGATQMAETRVQQAEKLPPTVTKIMRVTLAGGESVDIDPNDVERIRAQAYDWVATHSHTQMPAPLLEILDRETDAILTAVNQQVPAFADWYYSLSGEYVRIYSAFVGELPEYIEGKIKELVFDPAGTDEAITLLGKRLNDGLQEELQTTVINLQNVLTRLVREAGVETTDLTIEVDAEWALDQQLAEQVAIYVTPGSQDMMRQGAAVSAGALLSAAAVKKLVATSVAKVAAKVGTAQASGLFAVTASKLGVKVLASAGTGATTGAALCASSVVGAPLAPGCALVVGVGIGVGTWLLVDKTVIEADDWLNREAFEADVRQTLTDWRDALREEIRASYEDASNAAIDRLLAAVDNQIQPAPARNSRVFVPAEAAAKPVTQ